MKWSEAAKARSDALHERVQSLIAGGAEDFDALACDIARFQAEHVEPVGRLFAAQNAARPRVGERGRNLRHASDIPSMPSDAFRLRRIAAHPADDDKRCFATSGTTSDARGLHPMRRTDTYAKGALAWAHEMLLDGQVSFVGLVPDEKDAPESSLSFMLARFAETLSNATWHWDGHELDLDGIGERVASLRGPTLVAGTSFALVHLCDAFDADALPLPAGSRVMQTGGFKGRTREVDGDELRRVIANRFCIDQSQVVSEYGMTELSSQLYAHNDRYQAPAWLRVTAVDPETLAPVDNGEPGIARFVDLANVDSAVAVQTADIIREHADGIELCGRAPGATPRGCSLAMEHLIAP
jgi:hypothetical protein